MIKFECWLQFPSNKLKKLPQFHKEISKFVDCLLFNKRNEPLVETFF